jgi:hypothetical protein
VRAGRPGKSMRQFDALTSPVPVFFLPLLLPFSLQTQELVMHVVVFRATGNVGRHVVLEEPRHVGKRFGVAY